MPAKSTIVAEIHPRWISAITSPILGNLRRPATVLYDPKVGDGTGSGLSCKGGLKHSLIRSEESSNVVLKVNQSDRILTFQ